MLADLTGKSLFAAFIIGSITSSACAHPHAWIDVRTTVVLSAPATISAIREEWTFDKLYTNTVLTDSSGKSKPLDEFTQSAMRHLGPYHYFLELRSGGGQPAVGEAVDAKGEVRNGSLILRFTAPLAMPLDISKSALTLAVYDPTYYIDFEHVKSHPILFEGPGAQGCVAGIKQATPSIQAQGQAAAMDRGAPANPTLGRLFAQFVSIHCS